MADGFQTVEATNITQDAPLDDAPKAPTRMSRKRKALIIGVAGLAAKLALGVGAYALFEAQNYVTTDNAYVDASTAQINAQVSGQILEVLVTDTQFVKRGDVLAVIDPQDARLNLDRADADYRRMQQRVRQYYAQEASAAAQVEARRADLTRAEAEFSRRRALAQTGAVSGEELTATRSAYDAARANLAAANENLASQRALTQGTSVDRHPEVASARATLATARLSLDRTVIRAPIDGIVTQLNVQAGQRIEMSQGLMVVAPVQDAYVDANFKEGQLGRVRVGQPVTLHADLYGEKVTYHGAVAGLGGGTGSAFAVIPSQNATGNWIRVVQRVPVRIHLDPDELRAHPLRVGLSMEAKIDIREPKTAKRAH